MQWHNSMRVQTFLLLLLVVDTLFFSFENFVEGAYLDSVLEDAKSAGGDGNTTSWEDLGDPSWLVHQDNLRVASFASLSLFLVFEILHVLVSHILVSTSRPVCPNV